MADNDDGSAAADNSQTETYSRQAYQYSESTIVASTNKWYSFPLYALPPILGAGMMWKYLRNQAESSSDPYTNITQSANFAQTKRIGNCGEYASLAVTNLVQQGLSGVYFMQLTQGDHAWVMFSPSYALDVTRIEAWEKETNSGDIWLIDGWRNCCSAFDLAPFVNQYGSDGQIGVYWNN